MKSEQLQIKREVHDKLNYTEQQLMLLTQEMKDKIDPSHGGGCGTKSF